MTTPSFELGLDRLDLRAWVHDIAAEVVRAKIHTSFEGTSEIQRLVIARSISGAPIR